MQEGVIQYTFMQGSSGELSELEVSERLHAIVDEMLEPFGKASLRMTGLNALAPPQPPIDIAKPNQHDNKAEFQHEQRIVETSIKLMSELAELLAPQSDASDQKEMIARLVPVIDQKMRTSKLYTTPKMALDLISKSAADVGGYYSFYILILDTWTAFNARQAELKQQEEKFWNLPHRAPDYYARSIAVRLAKLYAKETLQRPTYGSAGSTGNPSTAYARALRKTFDVLGIRAGIRNHAEYAIDQITEDDLKQQTGLLGGFLGLAGMDSDSDDFTESTKKLLKKGPKN
ncbi:hypothetical protein EI983_03910 [Roseovarius faecimaris]|uniref:Uncharacterized protein n=1 Tax=Roseovarius faecimaris TaxID=2494550 RepID=A0A6I6IKS0_9RHOB|nr:hypothetical protein [Roseovarius faecimaris]QGX97469.1 hypothetical protein EI983_03910 [Roseovarius faecimaris]